MLRIIPFIFIGIGIGIPVNVFSQTFIQSVVASDGGTSIAGDIIFDWTIGEPVVESVYTDDRFYTQGFHQPFLGIAEIFDGTTDKSAFDITIVPNPVNTTLVIHINGLSESQLHLDMVDVSGKIVLAKLITTGVSTETLNVSQLPAGLYILRIFDSDNLTLNTFKISKM